MSDVKPGTKAGVDPADQAVLHAILQRPVAGAAAGRADESAEASVGVEEIQRRMAFSFVEPVQDIQSRLDALVQSGVLEKRWVKGAQEFFVLPWAAETVRAMSVEGEAAENAERILVGFCGMCERYSFQAADVLSVWRQWIEHGVMGTHAAKAEQYLKGRHVNVKGLCDRWSRDYWKARSIRDRWVERRNADISNTKARLARMEAELGKARKEGLPAPPEPVVREKEPSAPRQSADRARLKALLEQAQLENEGMRGQNAALEDRLARGKPIFWGAVGFAAVLAVLCIIGWVKAFSTPKPAARRDSTKRAASATRPRPARPRATKKPEKPAARVSPLTPGAPKSPDAPPARPPKPGEPGSQTRPLTGIQGRKHPQARLESGWQVVACVRNNLCFQSDSDEKIVHCRTERPVPRSLLKSRIQRKARRLIRKARGGSSRPQPRTLLLAFGTADPRKTTGTSVEDRSVNKRLGRSRARWGLGKFMQHVRRHERKAVEPMAIGLSDVLGSILADLAGILIYKVKEGKPPGRIKREMLKHPLLRQTIICVATPTGP
jgi:hypothetical protein